MSVRAQGLHHGAASSSERRASDPRKAEGLARALGWLSIGLGLAEVAAPGALARRLGMRGRERMLRLYGLRELAAGAGILASRRRAPWLWARVAGDALDLATLGTARRRRSGARLALGAVAGVTALDIACARRLQRAERARSSEVRDYSARSGFPAPAAEMRGAARDFQPPADLRAPEALRPSQS